MITVAGRDNFSEMPILCLDDLVRIVTVMCEVTRSTQLSARHRLHLHRFPRRIERDTTRENGRAPVADHTEASAAEASSILIDRRAGAGSRGLSRRDHPAGSEKPSTLARQTDLTK